MKIPEKTIQDTQFFRNIKVQQRSNYRAQMCQNQQIDDEQPVFYTKKYPSQSNFDYEKNCKLHYYFQQNSQAPKALLFFFHGMYYHGNTSGYLADVVSKNNADVNIFSLDFKNAGKSEGSCPGYYESIQSLVWQTLAFINIIQKKYAKSKPDIFISGLSMGGLIAFKLSVLYPERFKGVIMFSPALAECYEAEPGLKKVGRLVGQLFPTWKIVNQDHKGMNKYLNSEFNKTDEGRYLGKHPPGSAYIVLKQMDTLKNSFKYMKVPFIIFQSGVDKSVDLFAPLDLEKQSQVNDKTILYYKDAWHDILLQQQSFQICQLTADWINRRIKK